MASYRGPEPYSPVTTPIRCARRSSPRRAMQPRRRPCARSGRCGDAATGHAGATRPATGRSRGAVGRARRSAERLRRCRVAAGCASCAARHIRRTSSPSGCGKGSEERNRGRRGRTQGGRPPPAEGRRRGQGSCGVRDGAWQSVRQFRKRAPSSGGTRFLRRKYGEKAELPTLAPVFSRRPPPVGTGRQAQPQGRPRAASASPACGRYGPTGDSPRRGRGTPCGHVVTPHAASPRQPNVPVAPLASTARTSTTTGKTSTTIENPIVVLEISIVVLVRTRAARGIMRPAGAVAGTASVPYSRLSDTPAIS